MPLHLDKKAIRVLGVAESFHTKDKFSTLAGVVMRSDLVIDGFVIGKTRVSGSDATASLKKLFLKLKRNDVNGIIISGSVLSFYNIVDVDFLHKVLKVPIVALTFRKSTSDLERNIVARFTSKEASAKIELLRKLGTPLMLGLSTGYPVFVRASGLTKNEISRLLDRFTLQGAVPEPVRVARLMAKTVSALIK